MRAFESNRASLVDALAAGRRGMLIVALVTALSAAAGLFSLGPLDRDESRYAQATVQMLETGDYVRLYVQEDPRHKKPAGLHWLQAAAVSVVSSVEAREIWAFRLPSLLGAVLAAVGTLWAGTVLVGRRAAFIGALGLGVSVLLSAEGMIAKTDATLVASIVGSLGAVAHLRAGSTAKGLAWLFWLALAAGTLIKGPIAPMVVGLTLAAAALWERRFDWMRPLLHGPAIAAATVVTLPWFVAIGVLTHWEYYLEAIGHDLGAKVRANAEHPASPPGVHTLLIPILAFPLALGLPAAVRLGGEAVRAARQDPGHSGVRFLLAWAIPSLLVYELTPVKLAHYTLPIYPALALLAGAGLVAAAERGWRWTQVGGVALFAFAAAVLALLSGVVATFAPPVGPGLAGGFAGLLSEANPGLARPDVARATTVIGLFLAAGAAAGAVLLISRSLPVWLAVAAFSGLAANWTIREGLLPRAVELGLSTQASKALDAAGLHPRLDAAGPLLVVGYSEPSLVFLTDTGVRLALPEEAAQVAQAGQAALVADRHRAAFDELLAARGLVFEPVGSPTVGLNYSNGDPTALQPGRIAPTR